MRPALSWQASLLGWVAGRPAIDPEFRTARRDGLARGAWVEHVPGWLAGSDDLLAAVVARATWRERVVMMHGRPVVEPRLHAWFGTEPADPRLPPLLAAMAVALGPRYGRDFTNVGAALYRDGRDSVAWHGDRIPHEIVDPVVAIVSLGAPRVLRLRPRGGGSSRAFALHGGDLFVMGGTSQRTWEHSVPKTAHAGPRLSLQFRHGV